MNKTITHYTLILTSSILFLLPTTTHTSDAHAQQATPKAGVTLGSLPQEILHPEIVQEEPDIRVNPCNESTDTLNKLDDEESKQKKLDYALQLLEIAEQQADKQTIRRLTSEIHNLM